MRLTSRHTGVTLIELLVVVLIISVISTIATGVYTQQLGKAREAKTRQEIRTLEVAINQYKVDTGQFPPTGSGNTLAPDSLVTTGTYQGSGYLAVALRSSLNGNLQDPLSNRWRGPYIEWDINRMGFYNGTTVVTADQLPADTPLGNISFVDPYGMPYFYIRSDDYAARGGTELPDGPFAASEIYFNPSTFQIISFGPSRQSLNPPERGLAPDDITNFYSPAQ